MLNKRIKSLLVAGLVIVGMTGAAFAEGLYLVSKKDDEE